jgi:hypothetical protein
MKLHRDELRRQINERQIKEQINARINKESIDIDGNEGYPRTKNDTIEEKKKKDREFKKI